MVKLTASERAAERARRSAEVKARMEARRIAAESKVASRAAASADRVCEASPAAVGAAPAAAMPDPVPVASSALEQDMSDAGVQPTSAVSSTIVESEAINGDGLLATEAPPGKPDQADQARGWWENRCFDEWLANWWPRASAAEELAGEPVRTAVAPSGSPSTDTPWPPPWPPPDDELPQTAPTKRPQKLKHAQWPPPAPALTPATAWLSKKALAVSVPEPQLNVRVRLVPVLNQDHPRVRAQIVATQEVGHRRATTAMRAGAGGFGSVRRSATPISQVRALFSTRGIGSRSRRSAPRAIAAHSRSPSGPTSTPSKFRISSSRRLGSGVLGFRSHG